MINIAIVFQLSETGDVNKLYSHSTWHKWFSHSYCARCDQRCGCVSAVWNQRCGEVVVTATTGGGTPASSSDGHQQGPGTSAPFLYPASCLLVSMGGKGMGDFFSFFLMFGVLVFFSFSCRVCVCPGNQEKSWAWRRKFLEFLNLDTVVEPPPPPTPYPDWIFDTLITPRSLRKRMPLKSAAILLWEVCTNRVFIFGLGLGRNRGALL